LSRWGIFIALEKGQPIDWAAVALDGTIFPARSLQRGNFAVLWDIRVHPDHKRQGTGKALLQHVVQWTKTRGNGQLGLETDGSNLPAIKFYAKMGCELGAILK